MTPTFEAQHAPPSSWTTPSVRWRPPGTRVASGLAHRFGVELLHHTRDDVRAVAARAVAVEVGCLIGDGLGLAGSWLLAHGRLRRTPGQDCVRSGGMVGTSGALA